MSDSIGLQNRAYTESLQSSQPVKKTKGKQLLKIIIVAMLIFIAGDAVYYLFIVPFNAIAKIQFSGIDAIFEADIKKAAGLTGMEKWGKIDKDVFQKKFIQIFPEYGGKKIYVDDVFCIKNIDLSKVNFTKRLKRGIYRITIPGAKTIMEFNLLVPSMYE